MLKWKICQILLQRYQMNYSSVESYNSELQNSSKARISGEFSNDQIFTFNCCTCKIVENSTIAEEFWMNWPNYPRGFTVLWIHNIGPICTFTSMKKQRWQSGPWKKARLDPTGRVGACEGYFSIWAPNIWWWWWSWVYRHAFSRRRWGRVAVELSTSR